MQKLYSILHAAKWLIIPHNQNMYLIGICTHVTVIGSRPRDFSFKNKGNIVSVMQHDKELHQFLISRQHQAFLSFIHPTTMGIYPIGSHTF